MSGMLTTYKTGPDRYLDRVHDQTETVRDGIRQAIATHRKMHSSDGLKLYVVGAQIQGDDGQLPLLIVMPMSMRSLDDAMALAHANVEAKHGVLDAEFTVLHDQDEDGLEVRV